MIGSYGVLLYEICKIKWSTVFLPYSILFWGMPEEDPAIYQALPVSRSYREEIYP